MYFPTTAPALRLFCRRESETGYFVSRAHCPRHKSSRAVGGTENNTPGAAPCCGVAVCTCPYSPPHVSRAPHQAALGEQAATALQRWQFMGNACFWGGPWLLTLFYAQGLPTEGLGVLLASQSCRLSPGARGAEEPFIVQSCLISRRVSACVGRSGIPWVAVWLFTVLPSNSGHP